MEGNNYVVSILYSIILFSGIQNRAPTLWIVWHGTAQLGRYQRKSAELNATRISNTLVRISFCDWPAYLYWHVYL